MAGTRGVLRPAGTQGLPGLVAPARLPCFPLSGFGSRSVLSQEFSVFWVPDILDKAPHLGPSVFPSPEVEPEGKITIPHILNYKVLRVLDTSAAPKGRD